MRNSLQIPVPQALASRYISVLGSRAKPARLLPLPSLAVCGCVAGTTRAFSRVGDTRLPVKPRVSRLLALRATPPSSQDVMVFGSPGPPTLVDLRSDLHSEA